MNEQIQDILDNFNFKRVQDIMFLTPNEWWKGKDGGTPTIEELREYARRILEDVVKREAPNAISCGGFHAHKWPWRHDHRWANNLELIFALETWDA